MVTKLKKLTLETIRDEVKSLIEVIEIENEYYGGLESAITDSGFWLFPNTDNVGDYEKLPYYGDIFQTPSAEILQRSLQIFFNSIGKKIIIGVQSADVESNPDFLLGKSHEKYPQGVVPGGFATITDSGRQLIMLNMGVFDDTFDPDDFNEEMVERVSRKISGIIRHELIHFGQFKRRAEDSKISRKKSFKRFRDDPRAIVRRDNPKYWEVYEETEDLDKNGEPVIEKSGFKKELYRKDYRESYIEIDAHAHQIADELVSLLGKEEALRAISQSFDFTSLGADLPDAVNDYLMSDLPKETRDRIRSKTYSYIMSISS